MPARIDTQPRFRGITYESTSPLRRTASIFVDGVIVSGALQSIAVQELERVEVIKGPQSALFGRNTFSGAINYITKAPADEFIADISLDLASRSEYSIRASVEGPFSQTVGGRLYVNYSDKEGHYDNAEPLAAAEGQRLGDEESFSIGGVLQFTPSERVTIKLRGNIYEDDDGPAPVIRRAGFSDHNFCGLPQDDGSCGGETVFQGTVTVPRGAEIGLNTSQAFFDRITELAEDDPRGVNNINLTFDDLGGFGLVREGYRFAVDTSFTLGESLQLDILAGVNADEYLFMGDFDGSPDTADLGPFAPSLVGRLALGPEAGGPSELGNL